MWSTGRRYVTPREPEINSRVAIDISHLTLLTSNQELFKYKGQQIASAELESMLINHPAIQEAAVVGLPVPHDPSSEVPRAYVVADPAKVSEDEIKEFISSRLAPYKQLRGGVKFVDELPKNAIGKILRRELREQAKKELGAKPAAKL